MDQYSMINRGYLKARAKHILSLSYWKALLASLVLGLVTQDFASIKIPQGRGAAIGYGTQYFKSAPNVVDYAIDYIWELLPTFFLLGLILSIGGMALYFFLLSPIEVGGRRYFLESTQERFDFGFLMSGYSSESYLNVVKTQFFTSLYTFLWTLLLVIPGIVKGIAYSMVPYILAENPHIDSQRAITLSKNMTQGMKWQIFVFHLSFMGWFLLGSLLYGIGLIFVMPYYNAAHAELYLFLRTRAIDFNITSPDELAPGPRM